MNMRNRSGSDKRGLNGTHQHAQTHTHKAKDEIQKKRTINKLNRVLNETEFS